MGKTATLLAPSGSESAHIMAQIGQGHHSTADDIFTLHAPALYHIHWAREGERMPLGLRNTGNITGFFAPLPPFHPPMSTSLLL